MRGAGVLLGVGRGQFLAEPGHGAVEVLEAEVGGAVDGLIGEPLGGAAVRAGGAQAVQDGEEDGALDIEAEAAGEEGGVQGVTAAGALPEAFEEERGAEDTALGAGAQVLGGEDAGVRGVTGGGGGEAVEETGVLEAVEAAEGGEEALADFAVAAAVLDKLDIAVFADGFGAKEQAALSCHHKHITEDLIRDRI